MVRVTWFWVAGWGLCFLAGLLSVGGRPLLAADGRGVVDSAAAGFVLLVLVLSVALLRGR